MPQARDEDGNIWETDAQGNAVRLIQAAPMQGQVFAPPLSPAQQEEQRRKDRAQASNEGFKREASDRADRAEARAMAATNAALAEKGLMLGPDGVSVVPIPNWTPPAAASKLTSAERSKAIRAYTDAAALERIADDIEAKLEAGPGATKGVSGLLDYLPLEANKKVDDASFQARGYVKRALGFTGGEGNTIGEITLNYGPYLPESGDRDGQALEKVKALRQLAQDSRTQAVAVLGGAPDANGNITPVLPNAMLGGTMPAPLEAAPSGSTQKSVPIPDQMQQAHAQWIAQNAGRITPDNYAAFRAELDRQFGFTPDEAAYRKAAPGINEASQNSGYSPAIPPTTQEMSQVEQFRNDIVNNPIGAAATGALDAGSFGMVRALAPEQMGALEQARPVSTTLGQIGGAITGTSALGALGRQTLGRAAPSLLGGAGKAQFGRNLAADAAYGAAYGGITEGDPLTGGATGLIGSALGQGVGKAAGKVIGGVNVSPAVETLRNAGIPLTVGQTLGGFAKKLEDRFAGYPVVGDVIGNRRLESLQAFNQKAFDEAGAPIGFAPNAAGLDGLTQLQQATGNAYDQATAGVRIPLDSQYTQDLAGIQQLANRLPPDAVPALDKVGENYILPINNAGEMTGDVFQNTQRAIKMKRSIPPGSAQGFEQEWRDATSALLDANRGLMNRQGGQAVTQGLDSADMAYRLSKTLEDAVMRAKGGSQSGETFTFTPSQLQMAGQKSAAKFPGQRPFQQLADAGQEVLPSQVPDSGTAGRLATMALPGALVGGGAGAGAIYGGGEGAQAGATTSAALAILAMLGGTKSGQKAINNLFTQRPKEARKLGQIIANRSGMFGSAGNILSQQTN